MERHMRLAGYASSTRQAYARALRDIQDHFHVEAQYLTTEEITAFLDHRREQVSGSCLNAISCGLRYYFECVLGKAEVVERVPIPRKPQQLGELLNSDELRRLFEAAPSYKYRLVLALLFGMGLRAGEVGKILLSDFDSQHRTLTIREAKGGKHRVLPYSEGIRRLLINYYREEKPDKFLFSSSTRTSGDGRLSVRGVQYIVRQVLERSGLDKSVSPHTLRHCFAIQYLNFGGNLIRLKQLLGHSHLSTTLRYLSYADPELKDIASPYDLIFGV
ncbi:MAG: tyrosine-type recombinase/integrase [Bacteroidota bacterium]